MKLPLFYRLLFKGAAARRRILRKNFFTEFIVKRSIKGTADDVDLDAYRAPHPTPQDRVGVARFPDLIPETKDRDHASWATMASIEDGLEAFKDRPALVVWGLKDVAFRKPMLERWTGLFRDLEGPHKLPEARHYLQEDSPDAIIDLIAAWAGRKFLPAKGKAVHAAKGSEGGKRASISRSASKTDSIPL